MVSCILSIALSIYLKYLRSVFVLVDLDLDSDREGISQIILKQSIL